MEKQWEIQYNKLIFKKDFKKIPEGEQRKIVKTINKKLKKDPEAFGKPLTGNLKGYYRLRIDPYRVIYRIEKNKIIVYIIHIGLRKDFLVYIEAAKRLHLI